MGANSESCSLRSRSVSVRLAGASPFAAIVVLLFLAQAVAALLGDGGAKGAQAQIVGDEHVRGLAP